MTRPHTLRTRRGLQPALRRQTETIAPTPDGRFDSGRRPRRSRLAATAGSRIGAAALRQGLWENACWTGRFSDRVPADRTRLPRHPAQQDGRERDTGTRIIRPSERQAARQGIGPRPCALARRRPRPPETLARSAQRVQSPLLSVVPIARLAGAAGYDGIRARPSANSDDGRARLRVPNRSEPDRCEPTRLIALGNEQRLADQHVLRLFPSPDLRGDLLCGYARVGARHELRHLGHQQRVVPHPVVGLPMLPSHPPRGILALPGSIRLLLGDGALPRPGDRYRHLGLADEAAATRRLVGSVRGSSCRSSSGPASISTVRDVAPVK